MRRVCLTKDEINNNNLYLGQRLSQDVNFASNVLGPVFEYLTQSQLIRVATVCPLWADIVKNDKRWLTLSACHEHLVEYGAEFGINTTSLCLSLHSKNEIHGDKIKRYTTEELDVDRCSSEDCSLDHINLLMKVLKAMPKISKIYINKCSAALINQILESNLAIDSLGIYDNFSDKYYLERLFGVPSLKELKLYHDNEGFAWTVNPTLVSTNLEHLHLKQLIFADNFNWLLLTNLKSLEIGIQTRLDSNNRELILKSLQNLVKLKLSSPLDWLELVPQMKSLKELEICVTMYNSGNGLIEKLAKCTNIQKLTLYVDVTYTEQLIDRINEFSCLRTSLNSLTWKNVSPRTGGDLKNLRLKYLIKGKLGQRLSQDVDFASNVLGPVFEYLTQSQLIRVATVCPLWAEIVKNDKRWLTLSVCHEHLVEYGAEFGINTTALCLSLHSKNEIHGDKIKRYTTQELDVDRCSSEDCSLDHINLLMKVLKAMPKISKIYINKCSAALINQILKSNLAIDSLRIICLKTSLKTNGVYLKNLRLKYLIKGKLGKILNNTQVRVDTVAEKETNFVCSFCVMLRKKLANFTI